MSRGKRISEEMYNRAKLLCDKGLKCSDTAEILGISKSTIEFIKRSSSFDNYSEIRNSYREKDTGRSHKKKEDPDQGYLNEIYTVFGKDTDDQETAQEANSTRDPFHRDVLNLLVSINCAVCELRNSLM